MPAKLLNPAVSLQDGLDKYQPFIMEIRKRLFFVVSLFLIAAALGFIYYEKVIGLILQAFDIFGVNIVFTSPFQFINLAINSGIIVGLIVVLPLFIYQMMSFLKPALSQKEYKIVMSMIPLSLLLFLFGFTYGIVMMRYVLILFYERSLVLDIGNFLDISLFLSQVLITATLMGVAFQFPIVLTVLTRLKVVKITDLKKQRLVAYSASLIFAAFLPPTDLVSLALLTVPLIVLFESTLFVNKNFLKARA